LEVLFDLQQENHMALMFSRVARNFIKNGYFPTDEVTLSRVLSALSCTENHTIRILDPCCGEGSALAEVGHHLSTLGGRVESFGIEYDEERAWHAKQLLNRCIHADLNDCVVSPRAFSLLWLNPPYGDLVGDSERTSGSRSSGRKRLEKEFCKRCFPLLQAGGVLVLIVPYTVLDKALSCLISRYFQDVSVFAAPEQQFRQAVVFGVRRPRVVDPDLRVVQMLMYAQENRYRSPSGEWVEGFTAHCVLPEAFPAEPYEVPPAEARDLTFHSVAIDQRQLQTEVDSTSLLWGRFSMLFRVGDASKRPPLRKLSSWHLALMLAAGQVSGVVKSPSGRTLLVKGDTHKAKNVRTETEFNDETGAVSETRIATDRFVALIRAIDFTPDSPTFGRVIHIE
jgi:tRNA1(Val) A37 N6-methylase TrmN6